MIRNKESKGRELSFRRQKYIETIHELCCEHGHAHTKSVAERLGIKMASVTEALRSLSEAGFINYRSREGVTLTAKGHLFAAELDERHSVLADFFHNILGSPKDLSEKLACRAEHSIDEDIRLRLRAFMNFLRDEEARTGKKLAGEFKKSFSQKRAGAGTE